MSPRQIDQSTLVERENVLLDAAMLLIKQQGVEGLTMDKLVKQVSFSKGTVYNHFTCKEDLMLGLCNRGMGLLGTLFTRAGKFEGTTRERIIAIHFAYLLYSRLYPMMFMLVISAKSPGVTEKASTRNREVHLQLEASLTTGIINIICQALTEGECSNPNNLAPEQIAFANWSSAFGTIALLSKDFEQCGIRAQMQSEQALLANVNLMLDGLQWQPLFSEFDYTQTLERLRCEVFAPEIELLAAQEQALQC